jgi:hypothetical protein
MKISLFVLSFISFMIMPIKLVAIIGFIIAILGIRRLIQLIKN